MYPQPIIRCASYPQIIRLGIGLLCFTVAAFAQQLASLSGNVTDSTNAVVANATIRLTNVQTGENYTATTNENGSFTIPLIKPGPYEMNVQAQGFKQYKRGGLVLETATPARVDVALEVGAVTDVVNVEASAPLLQTENSSVRILACRIRDAAIQRLGASAA